MGRRLLIFPNGSKASLLAVLLIVSLLLLAPSPSAHAASSKSVGSTATFVLGHPDFTSKNKGTGQTQLDTPEGVAIDRNGGIYVADSHNNRVLHFPATCMSNHTNGCTADLVIGQPDFTAHEAGASPSQLDTPESVALD